jgi:hypothetical protein
MSRLKSLLSTLPRLKIPAHEPNNTLYEFTLFPKLPPELRNKIWKYAAFEPRVIKVLVDAKQVELVGGPWNSNVEGQIRHPGIMQACRESRQEGRRYYERCQERFLRTYKALPKEMTTAANLRRFGLSDGVEDFFELAHENLLSQDSRSFLEDLPLVPGLVRRGNNLDGDPNQSKSNYYKKVECLEANFVFINFNIDTFVIPPRYYRGIWVDWNYKDIPTNYNFEGAVLRRIQHLHQHFYGFWINNWPGNFLLSYLNSSVSKLEDFTVWEAKLYRFELEEEVESLEKALYTKWGYEDQKSKEEKQKSWLRVLFQKAQLYFREAPLQNFNLSLCYSDK